MCDQPRHHRLAGPILEPMVDDDGVDRVRLEISHGSPIAWCKSRRCRAYVEQLLTLSGLQSKIIQADLRMEAGVPVRGLVVRAAKPNASHPLPGPTRT